MAGARVLVIDDSPTIVRVVQLVLTKAGFDVATATDGEAGLAEARDHRPDLILLDFVMPKLNGYQVCRELAADPELRDIPVVLLSAKGDQVGERFVKVMGIVDYITKPFAPEALTAVVQHTIAKYGGRHHVPSDQGPVELGDDGARAAALAELRGQLADAVGARVAALFALAGAAGDEDLASRIPTDAGAIADAARSALDDKSLAQILASVDVPAALGGASALTGDLRVIPLAEVLQLVDHQEQTGLLVVSRGAAEVGLHFRRGRIDQALATGLADDLLLGRFLVDAEVMTATALDIALRDRLATPGDRLATPGGDAPLLGAYLVRQGIISAHDLSTALGRQSRELVYEALRWRTGRFRFAAGSPPPPAVAEARLELDVQAILMEGFRRVDEWHLIEREIDDFELVFLRNEDAVAQMGRGRLTREEMAVLELVNGKNSIKDIVRKSRMGSFEVSKMLYRLLSIKLVRRRVQAVAI